MTKRIALRLAAIGLTVGLSLSAAHHGQADDTAIFTTAVPPNVMLFIDNSGSMNTIMTHPAWNQANSTCALFTYIPPNTGGSNDCSSGGKLDQNGKRTPCVCDASSQDCRFQIDSNTTGFVQTGTYTCDGGTTTTKIGYITRKYCGKTRKMYVDPDTACKANQTWYDEAYSEWYFSPDADPYFGSLAEPNTSTDPNLIDADQNGTRWIDNSKFALYKRTRITAAKEIARDVLFQTNTNCPQGTGVRSTLSCPFGYKDVVRFGVAQFDANANGGFVRAPVGDYSTNRTVLDGAIDSLDAQTYTPLAESLFKIYTYFMPGRLTATTNPFGKNGTTRFPGYVYRLSDGAVGTAVDSTGTDTTKIPPDPLKCPGSNAPCSCQKNFVMIITDGEPTQDIFQCDGASSNGFCSVTSGGNSNTAGVTRGFGDFKDKLIGDYNADGETEYGYAASGNGSLFLDDIAKYMHEKDFRPDVGTAGTSSEKQTLDVYTVGFRVDSGSVGGKLLAKTAQVGGGLSFFGQDAQSITNALVSSIQDVIHKSQSFTAATVPASRTTEGGNFYLSQFVPSGTDPFWQGHIYNLQIDLSGKILDANGNCAVDDPSGNCKSGSLLTSAVPFWDAGAQVPAPAARNLSVSLGNAEVAFNTSLTAANLGVTYVAGNPYISMGSTATTSEGLADEIVQYARGCALGTGVTNSCTQRLWLLGDVFHSNPVVVGKPSGFISEPSYQTFATTYATRDRLIYAGANDGFVHGFEAGTWDTSLNPDGYNRGTGAEVFGFMPWSVRQNIKQLPIDTGNRDFYYVDGSPQVADVWLYPTTTTTTKSATDWHTILVGGLRQGGNNYYALDITDPSSAGFPGYLWEFPRESDPATIKNFVGQTWSEPVITRVKVKVGTNDNNGQGFERWVVIVGGGYDPTGDPNVTATYNATATAGRALFMLDAKTGAILAEKKLDTVTPGSETTQMKYAIASSPAVLDLDFDGYADVVYVGDLGGNVWKWVIHGVGVDDGGAGGTAGDGKIDRWYQTSGTTLVAPTNPQFVQFFSAPSYPAVTPSRFRSFFFPPSAAFKNGVLWLGFGSGERADLKNAGITGTTADNNRFYAVKDLDPYETSTSPTHPIVGSTPTLTDLTSNPNNTTPVATVGWFFTVPADGEKFVTNSDVFFYEVLIASFTPVTTTDPCVAGGNSSLYTFRIDTSQGFFDAGGGNFSRGLTIGGGVPTDPQISISPNGVRVIGNKSDGSVINIDGPKLPRGGVGVQSWRERTQ